MREPIAAGLERLLGLSPHRPRARAVQRVGGVETPVRRIDELLIEGERGAVIPALLSQPLSAPGPVPAVLYAHAHGRRYDIGKRELIEGRPSLLTPAYAEALAGIGLASLCLDMPTFGARAGETEQELAKRRLWQGGTLFGDMLRDLQAGLDVLERLPGIDGARLGALGMSMGATQAFWLAALDPRVTSLAHLCCFADLATLVDSGAHDLHGLYMVVPGLAGAVSTGEIAAAAAPRPQLCCVGLADPLTPEAAVRKAAATVDERYAALGVPDRWHLHVEQDGGHRETTEMRRLVLEHFRRTLSLAAPSP